MNLHIFNNRMAGCHITPVQCKHEALSMCRRNYSSKRRSHRHRLFLLALCSVFIAACTWTGSYAFSLSPSTQKSTISIRSSIISSGPSQQQRYSSSENRRFYMSAIIEPPSQSSPASSRMSDFQRRMKGIVKRNGVASGKKTVGTSQSATERPANLKVVHTLEEYKNELDASSEEIVVVRFFATWCKACKAIQPSFYRMASLYPHMTFLEVPVTNQNVNLHQGLEVPSLPYGHIYYPEAGLVEEMKISKKYFHGLVKMVRWYDEGLCGLDEFVPEGDDDDDDEER